MTLPLDLIQFLRGNIAKMASEVGVLAEGEPCLAGVVLPDQSVFELLYLGGHDGANKLLAGGMQSVQGEPAWNVPDPYNPGFYVGGITAYDALNRLIWISNTDGSWSGFCNCIPGSPPGPTSSSGAAGSTGGIVVAGCPNTYLPFTLFGTVSGASGSCSCFNGSYPLNYDSSLGYWWGKATLACSSINPVYFMFGWLDAGASPTGPLQFPGTWNFAIGDSNTHASKNGYAGTYQGTTLGSASCSPFDVASIFAAGNLTGFCSSGAPTHWEVTI